MVQLSREARPPYTTSQPIEHVRYKKTPDFSVVERRQGLTSLELAENCPDSRMVFPTRPCTNAGCEYAIKQPAYMNCTFLAAECGEHTLEAIGEMMGLTREGVRVIEMRALRKVREQLQALDRANDDNSLRKSGLAPGTSNLDPELEGTESADQCNLLSLVHG